MGCKGVWAGVTSSLLFIVLNASLNLYTKWLFSSEGGNFPFPWTMLAAQQLESYIVLQTWLAYTDAANSCGWGAESQGLRDVSGCTSLIQVLAATALFCLNVGLNSLSLVRISITLNQTVRAFLPVGVLLLGSCIERRIYPMNCYATTAVIVSGIALTCVGTPAFEWFGFSLALLSTFVAAVGSSLNGWLLNAAGPFQNASGGIARLMMLQSVPAFFLFSTVALFLELPHLSQAVAVLDYTEIYVKIALVLVSGIIALLSNLGRCGLVAATGALMETMAGNAKVALLCEIDHAFFGTVLTGRSYFGILLTFSAFSTHVLLQYANKAAVTDDDQDDPDDALEEEMPLDGARKFQGSPAKPPIGSPFKKVKINLPRMISGAETGLAAEHVALRLGKRSGVSPMENRDEPLIFRNWSFAAVREFDEDEHGTPVYSRAGFQSSRSNLTMHSDRSMSWQPGDVSPQDNDLWESIANVTPGAGTASLPSIPEFGDNSQCKTSGF